MKYNLTSQEVEMLLAACGEYIEMMGQGEDTADYTEYMVSNGLGSAIRELGKDRNIGKVYRHYTKHRENYKYPTFEEWKGGAEE